MILLIESCGANPYDNCTTTTEPVGETTTSAVFYKVSLPETGSDIGAPVRGGIVLLIVGTVAVLSTRRKKEVSHVESTD